MDADFGLHAEAVTGRPDLVRWVTTAELPAIGRLRSAPGELGVLLDQGLLADPMVERNALWTRLTEGTWAQHGARVRDAIIASANDFGAWQIEPAADEVLELVARDIIDRSLGAYIASHGGQIELLSAANRVVEVALKGACAHCPASGQTLHERIERSLNERLRGPIMVVADGECNRAAEQPGWWPKLLRRGRGG